MTVPERQIVAIRPGDANFILTDGFKIVHRAEFEISNDTPLEYVRMIYKCYRMGWLKPVANIKSKELFWEVLEE